MKKYSKKKERKKERVEKEMSTAFKSVFVFLGKMAIAGKKLLQYCRGQVKTVGRGGSSRRAKM